ncbi:MAG: flexitail domain-containing putative surface protein [Dehalococcoidia bacterium]
MKRALALIFLSGLVATALFAAREQPPAAAAGIAMVSVGGSHACAVTNAGAAKCWGFDSVGQLGGTAYGECSSVGDSFPCASTPIDVAGLSSGVASISAGGSHTCAVTAAGAAVCWGHNDNGQLGDGTTTNRSTPVQVLGLTSGVTAIDAGFGHTCAYASNGLACWGSDRFGELGVVTQETCESNFECSTVPIDLTTGALSGFAVGDDHTCAITALDGSLRCWGGNAFGQLGNGTTNNVSGPGPVSPPLNQNVAMVSAGRIHTCAVTDAGAVFCWGSDVNEQIGAVAPDTCASTPCAMTPVAVVGLASGYTQVSAASRSTCALNTGADIKCWGNNSLGQVGNGTNDTATTPVDICRVVLAIPDPACIASLLPAFASVSGGGDSACAMTTGALLECWGWNEFGQLGNATMTDRNAPGAVFGLFTGTDADSDGCTTSEEQQTAIGSQLTGGRRDPKHHWDFFDTPAAPNARDKAVTAGDLARVVQRFGAVGVPNGNPLSTPPGSGYHTAFDRSSPQPGRDLWDLGPPDGSITVADIAFAVVQFGHSCA